MKTKYKHRYLRRFLKEKKIKDGYLKSCLYGAMFDLPKKVEKNLNLIGHPNHREHILKYVLKLAYLGKSNNVINKYI